jgi:hypothetical protein
MSVEHEMFFQNCLKSVIPDLYVMEWPHPCPLCPTIHLLMDDHPLEQHHKIGGKKKTLNGLEYSIP